MSPSSRRLLSLFLGALVAFQPALLTGCASFTPDKRILQYLNKEGFGKRYTGNAEEENYIGIGDSVSFVDTFNPDVADIQVVDIDGTIQIPEAGAVFVAGLTRSELESYLTQKLSPYYIETDVKVIIRTGPQSKVYYVLGEVLRQGAIPFPGNLTVFDAVIQAIPSRSTANLGRVRVIRADPRDPIIIRVNISDMWEKGDATYNIPIQENDIIFVPPTFLKEIADFVSAIIVPLTSVISSVFRVLFQFILADRGFGGGGNNGGFFF